MYKIKRATVEERIQNGYHFDFGKYISDGINIFGKDFLQFVLFTLISCFLILFSVITIVGPSIIFFCTLAGYACAAEKIEKGERVSLNDFFEGYNNLGDKIVLGLIYFGFSLLLYIPYLFSFASMGSFSSTIGPNFNAIPFAFLIFSYLFIYVGMLVLNSALLFSIYLIQYGDYSGVESVKKSFQLYRKSFWMVTLFTLVLLILAYVGLMFCLIGFLFTFPILGTSFYALAKNTLMNPDHSEIDQIGNYGYTN